MLCVFGGRTYPTSVGFTVSGHAGWWVVLRKALVAECGCVSFVKLSWMSPVQVVNSVCKWDKAPLGFEFLEFAMNDHCCL